MSQTDRTTGLVGNAAFKVPCRAATTADITLSGLQTLDGVTLAANDRVLVKDQDDPIENGIWIADTGAWSRAKDCDGSYDLVKGSFIYVTDGTVAANTYWRVTTANPIVIGTSSITIQRALINDDSTIEVQLDATGAVARTQHGKNAEVVSAKDVIGETYGADDTTALQGLITYEGATGGREIHVNAGTLITTGVTLPGTSGQQVSLKGDPQTKIKAKAGASVVVQINNDITRTGFREIKSLKIDGSDIANVTGLKVGTTTSSALQVYMRSIDVRDCATGIDLYSSMENSLTDVVCYQNTIGLKLRQDPTNGGANANRLDGLRLQENTIGAVFDADSALPMGQLQINQPLVQSNTLCGMAFIGVDEGVQINAAHFEANATAGTTLAVDGNTIEKCPLFLDASIVTLSESTLSEASANPCIILRNNSRLILRNSGGYGLAGTFIDGTLSESVQFYGYCSLLGKIKARVDRWPDTYLESASQWSGVGQFVLKQTDTIPNDFVKNPYAPLLENAVTATINTDFDDSQLGPVSNATFAASVGSTGANRVVIDALPTGVTSGDTWIISALVRASSATNINFLVTDGSHVEHPASLDTKWRRVVLAFRAASTNSPILYLYPNDSVGATVYFARLHSLRIASGGDMSQAYAMVREGLFNDRRRAPVLDRVSTDNGNAAATLTVGTSTRTQQWNTVITADRAVALSTTGAKNGDKFHIVRTAAATGAFNLNVGTGPLKALAAGQWCDVEYNGSAWMLTAFGSL